MTVGLTDTEDDAVLAATPGLVGVAGLVGGQRVEHVAPARQPVRQEVRPRRLAADREVAAVRCAATRPCEALQAPAVARAAPAVGAREAQPHGAQPRRVRDERDRAQRGRRLARATAEHARALAVPEYRTLRWPVDLAVRGRPVDRGGGRRGGGGGRGPGGGG